MATLSQKGAGYANRAYVLNKDPRLAESLDDLASQIQTVATQTNASKQGTPTAPEAPAAITASAKNGLFTVQIVHPNAPVGTQWHLQYSTSPTFTNPVDVGLAHPVFQASLPQQVLYFRASAKFPTSAESGWTYLGSAARPLSVS